MKLNHRLMRVDAVQKVHWSYSGSLCYAKFTWGCLEWMHVNLHASFQRNIYVVLEHHPLLTCCFISQFIIIVQQQEPNIPQQHQLNKMQITVYSLSINLEGNDLMCKMLESVSSAVSPDVLFCPTLDEEKQPIAMFLKMLLIILIQPIS